MRYLLNCCFILVSTSLIAQNTQWASEVIEFSSQYMTTKYSAEQVLGAANVYPKGGNNKLAWSPKTTDGKLEFIKVGFEKPMKVAQIVVYETFKPGAVSAIYAYDAAGNEYFIQKFSPKSTMRMTRKLEVKFPLTDYEVTAVKIELVCKKVEGYNQVDAIAISNSDQQVEVKIEVAEDLEFEGEMERLGPGINTDDYADQNANISPDGSTIFFNRRNHPTNFGGVDDENEIWVSHLKEDGEWDIAYNIGRPLNNKSNNFVCSVTPDGNTLLLGNTYNTDGTMGSGLSLTHKTKTGWSFPVGQSIKNYYNNNKYVEYYMSNSGRYLLIACERNDTKGGRDIYVCFRTENNSWSEPLNLGKTVNTADEELTPFLAADDKTIYFSSHGHPGFGNADIFISQRMDDSWTNWSKPMNLGKNINSDGWDAGYAIAAKGDYAYFNSNKLGSTDIYRIKLPQELQPEPVVLISGKVFDNKTNEPMEATVYYEYLVDGKEAGIARSNPATGEYKIVLPYGFKYGFRGHAPDYISINENLDLSEVSEYKEVVRDLTLVPIEVGQVVRLNNIFFEFGKSTLKEESFPELNRVIELMNENPNMTLEISGHTDDVGSGESNLKLSQSRAASVVQYLIAGGITDIRLTAKGYGETQPVIGNDTEEGRALNRRVEFRIIKK